MAVRFAIETLSYSSSLIVWHGRSKAAILFPPAEAGGGWSLYPHPGTYPGLGFEGLPKPLRPDFMRFDSLASVHDFLGLPRPASDEARTALAA